MDDAASRCQNEKRWRFGVYAQSSKRNPLRRTQNERLIWAITPPGRPLIPSAYRITDAKGNEIPVAGVLPNEAKSTLIVPAQELDKRRVYYLEIPSMELKAHCSYDGWFRETYSTKELGAIINGKQTTIRLFAPRAEMVKLYLYKNKDDQKAYENI